MKSQKFEVKCGKMERVTISFRESFGQVVAYKVKYIDDKMSPMIFALPCTVEPTFSYYKSNYNNYIGNSITSLIHIKIKSMCVNFNKDGTVRDIDVVI